MSLITYDPNAKYWIVYQYGPDQVPHIFTSNDHDEASNMYEQLMAYILAFKLSDASSWVRVS